MMADIQSQTFTCRAGSIRGVSVHKLQAVQHVYVCFTGFHTSSWAGCDVRPSPHELPGRGQPPQLEHGRSSRLLSTQLAGADRVDTSSQSEPRANMHCLIVLLMCMLTSRWLCILWSLLH